MKHSILFIFGFLTILLSVIFVLVYITGGINRTLVDRFLDESTKSSSVPSDKVKHRSTKR